MKQAESEETFDIAVEGCAHGELDAIFNMITYLNEEKGKNIQLLICCGDFQSVRNNNRDLKSMAVPPKYQKLNSFHYYYEGIKKAPCLTIFIGGNHEASEYLWELPYGGWVAPNIYYMGWANIINFVIRTQKDGKFYQKIIRISGISGIYKKHHFMLGHHEFPPFNEDTKRSIYHQRNIDIYKLNLIHEPLDIFISHDWPLGIWQHGDTNQLLSIKPYFRSDIESNKLGSPALDSLLKSIKPDYWFSAHLHVKFAALYPHKDACNENHNNDENSTHKPKFTRFLALDKCLPNRKYLQIIPFNYDISDDIRTEDAIQHDNKRKADEMSEDKNIAPTEPESVDIISYFAYDQEWLSVLKKTDNLINVYKYHTYLPQPSPEFLQPNSHAKNDIIPIPENFLPCHQITTKLGNRPDPFNQQTVAFCETYGLTNFCAKQMGLLKDEEDEKALSSKSEDSP